MILHDAEGAIYMVFDGENLFFKNKVMSGSTINSDVVANGKGGDAYDPLWLLVVVNKDLSAGPATVELVTGDTDKMAGSKTIGSYKVDAKKGSKIMARVPVGAKSYLQVKVSGQTFTSGELTAALVSDVDLK